MSTQKTAWLIVACCLLPFASEGLAQGRTPRSARMLTIVVSGEWGVARTADIEKLLSDAASHINGLLRTPWTGELHVRSAPPSDPTPRTLLRCSKTDPIVIQLACKDRRWNQYAYQFAHEFCHVLSGYEGLEGNPNNWFHETICELASVFTLRRMAERWPTHPPYPNWAGYSKHLLEYAAKRQKREEVQLSIGVIAVRQTACYRRRDLSETAMTAPCPRVSSPPWNTSFSTGTVSACRSADGDL